MANKNNDVNDHPESQVNPEEQETQEVEETTELEVEEVDDDLEALQAKLKDANDKTLRAHAEMINFRKRQEKERGTWHQLTTKEVVSSFLEPFDNLHRALSTADEGKESHPEESSKQLDSLIEGVKMVVKQLDEALASKNITSFDPMGEKLDPNFHEAFGQIESEEIPEGHVANVFRLGYKIGEDMLRTSIVQVAKSPAEKSDESETE